MARRARELGFASTVGIIHDGEGQLRPLGEREQRVYQQVVRSDGKSFSTFAYYNQFQKNLILGKANWSCRAGSRYLYICEDGLVHYCSQQRGAPSIPLEQYGAADLEREYHTVKPCAPYCTVSCVQQASMIDQFRAHPTESLTRFFPSNSGQGIPYDPPGVIKILAWMFLPPTQSKTRTKLTHSLTRVALWCLKVK